LTEISSEIPYPSTISRCTGTATLSSLPDEISIRWGDQDGRLSFSGPSTEPRPQDSWSYCVIVGTWGDHPFEAILENQTLSTLIDLALPGCCLAQAKPDARILFLEHALSKTMVNGISSAFNGIRILRIYTVYSKPELPAIFDVELKLTALNARIRVFGGNGLILALAERWSGLPQVPLIVASEPIDIRFVSGVALVPRTDMLKLKEGNAIVVDECVHLDGRLIVVMYGQPVAIGRRSEQYVIADRLLDPSRTALSAIWSQATATPGDVRLTFEVGRITMRSDEFRDVARRPGILLPPRGHDEVDIIADGKPLGLGLFVQLGGETGVQVTRLF
jgi:hypothetical protein